MKLEEIREKIDQIDSHLLQALERRMELAFQAAREKKHIYDPQREKEVLSGIKHRAQGSPWVNEGFVERIFSEIISESRRIQQLNSFS